jgi:hypothetical protein
MFVVHSFPTHLYKNGQIKNSFYWDNIPNFLVCQEKNERTNRKWSFRMSLNLILCNKGPIFEAALLLFGIYAKFVPS